MAWYYVKNGGTNGASARQATEASGAFSGLGDTFDSIASALGYSTPPVAGDFVMCSNAHDHNGGGGAITYSLADIDGLTIVSVSNTDVTAYSAGAIERTTSSITISSARSELSFWGVDLRGEAANPISLSGNNMHVTFNDGTLRDSGTGSNNGILELTGDSVHAVLNDMTLRPGAASQRAIEMNSGYLEINGGSIDSTESTLEHFFYRGFLDNGGVAIINGMDLSNMVDASTSYLVEQVGAGDSFDDTMDIRFINCDLPDNVSFVDETLAHGTKRRIELINTDRYELKDNVGDVTMVTTPYVTDQQQLQGGTQATLEVHTVARCTRYRPLIVPIPVSNVDLSAAASDVITVYCATTGTQTFDDQTLVLVVRYSDATTPTLAKFASSAGNKAGDWLPSPTAAAGSLTTTSTLWTGTIDAEYSLSVDLSSASPDGLPPLIHEAWVYVMEETTGTDRLLIDTEMTAA